MTEDWIHFLIVICVQFLFFIIQALYTKRLSRVPSLLFRGALIGIPVGLSFDLILGKFLGVNSYALGFGAFFLIVNAVLSYGLFASSTLLIERARFVPFCIWTVLVVVVYEITNHFFRVWTWEFTLPPLFFGLVLLGGYLGGALLVAIIAQVFFGYKFSLFKSKHSV